MKSIPATSARFGHLIDITRHGRDVAVVLSPEECRRMDEAARGKVNLAVERLHAECATRWARVYEALAK